MVFHGSYVGDAEAGDVGSGVEELAAEVALGLQGAEFGGAFVKEPVRKGACAINGSLNQGRICAIRTILKRTVKSSKVSVW
jgi:hypothetical protein